MARMDDDKLREFGGDAHGKLVSNGYYAISPNGDLVLLPELSKLKQGWRLATTADIDAKERAARGEPPRSEREPAPLPPADDEPHSGPHSS